MAVVGASGWGRNVVRAFYVARGSTLRWICDLDADRLAGLDRRFPGVRLTRTFDQVLGDREVGAVAIAVDAPNHHRLARAALLAGRHVFVEKPLALDVRGPEELGALAQAQGSTV